MASPPNDRIPPDEEGWQKAHRKAKGKGVQEKSPSTPASQAGPSTPATPETPSTPVIPKGPSSGPSSFGRKQGKT